MSDPTDPIDPANVPPPQHEEALGPGKDPASRLQIVGLATVLTVMILLVFYLLIEIWPHPTPSTAPPPSARDTTRTAARTDSARTDSIRAARDSLTGTDSTRTADTTRAGDSTRAGGSGGAPRNTGSPPAGPAAKPTVAETGCRDRIRQEWATSEKPAPAGCVTLFGREVLLWDEQRLLALVMLGGALGSLLHALRSLGWYVGNRKLVRSWIARYLFLGLTGAALAFVFYVVVRGGFFAPNTTLENTSPYGFVAFATLVGLFSEQAVLKLKDVAETLLAKPGQGRDAAPQHSNSETPDAAGTALPVISGVTAAKDASGNPTGAFVVNGAGFVAQSQVAVNGTVVTSTYVSATELRFTITPAPAAGTALKVEVRNPGNRTVSRDVTV